MLRKLLTITLITLLPTLLNAAPPEKRAYPGGRQYMVRLTLRDKRGGTATLARPEDYLSPRAIERRRRQNIAVDSTDLPVSPQYLAALREKGAEVVSRSKWTNTVVVRGGSLSALKALGRLPFVSETRLVWRSPDSISVTPPRPAVRKELSSWDDPLDTDCGVTTEQLAMLSASRLHELGFRGQGMMIAVLDGGFMNVDRIEAFREVSIAGVADMVTPRSKSIYRETDHGTKVLSALGVNVPGRYRGTAPGAAYWLIRCEDSETEQLVEEDYWAAAAEFADSVGADVVSSSLGYHEFDYKEMNHAYRDLDGLSALCSRAASMLAGKGMVCVNSAGNDGMGSWKKINVPADARDIITVGAVTPQRKNAAFSSIGPTADGRVKPDVMAQGSPAAVVTGRGTILNDMGTSFAAPQVAGMVACLWQSVPQKTAREIIDIVRRMGDNASQPDNIYGYGIPDFSKRP